MAPHPPVRSRPAALWRLPGGPRSGPSATPEVLAYRPDWFAQRGPGALQDPALAGLAFREPACAVALLTGYPQETQSTLEAALAGAGEAVYHYLTWCQGRGPDEVSRVARRFHDTLVRDGHWGIRHARRVGDVPLLAEIETWCGDERQRFAAAAALHCMRHPRESPKPVRELIASDPFYAYVALPRLQPRGFRIEPREVTSAKWAWHFAVSELCPDRHRFLPQVWKDPAWAIEFGAAKGWLTRADCRGWLQSTLRESAQGHPLFALADQALAAAPPVPAPLAAGRAAEVRALIAMDRPKNSAVWRPNLGQMQSDRFRAIVGAPQFTDRGYPRGTILDADEGAFAEIKSGRSPLEPSYQLRLQAFRSAVEQRALTIYTGRPPTEPFRHWAERAGVKVEPLP